MGCILLLVLVGFPRVALFGVWLTQRGWIGAAFDNEILWPVLGFCLLPTTTLAFVYGMNALGSPGAMTPLGWLLTLAGLAFDIGAHRTSTRRVQREPVD